MREIEMRVVKVLKENADKRDIDDLSLLNSDFRDLGINSLNFIKVVVALEEEFDIQFDDNKINYELFGKVKDLVSLIEKELEK